MNLKGIKLYRWCRQYWNFLYWHYWKCRNFKHTLLVDSNARSAGTSVLHGHSWKYPLATLDAAIRCCSPNTVIFLSSGHKEVVSLENPIASSTANLSIVGLSDGKNRPCISYPSGEIKEYETENKKTDL